MIMNLVIALLLLAVVYEMGASSLFIGTDSPGLLAAVLIIPIMIVLTYSGTGYKFANRGEKTRVIVVDIAAVPLAAAAYFLPSVFEHYWGLVFLILFYETLRRGILITGRAFSAKNVETHLNLKKRMKVAGPALIASGLLCGYTVLSFGGMFPVSEYADQREKAFKDYTAYQAACTRVETAGPAETSILRELARTEFFKPYYLWGYDLKLTSPDDESSFKLHMTPTRFPFFPYHKIMTLPAYMSDETGAVRKVYVSEKKDLFPVSAPVIYTLNDEDVRSAAKRFLPLYEYAEPGS